jgi:superfamily II DNA or RNA helicase
MAKFSRFSQHPKAHKVRASGVFAPATTFSVIERRIADLKTRKERGDAFELFAEAFLATQLVMAARSVWVNAVIPVSVLEKMNIPHGGAGIDGIYETRTGDVIPYQVKFRDQRPTLTLDELSGFYALSSAAKTKLLFTNCDSVTPHATSRSGYISVLGSQLDRLELAQLQAICAWARGERPRPERYSPLPHQKRAIADIDRTLARNDRATVVMACGTGKTLVALWTVEQRRAQRVLVLLPSLALLSQTLEQWALHTSLGEKFHYLCVCSDTSASWKGDEWCLSSQDLSFRVGTDPKEVRRFLTGTSTAVRVVFSTYQSSPVVAEAMKGLDSFDIGIFDEAHKTAGRSGTSFAFTLSDTNLAIRKRVFLTATPRHYNIRKRDEVGDLAVTSMDDETTYGPVAHRLSFRQASEEGLLCRYRIIISIVDSDTLDSEGIKRSRVLVAGKETHASWIATQLALKHAVRRTSVKHIISFHRDVNTAKAFTSPTPHGIQSHLPRFVARHVNGSQPVAMRSQQLRAFREDRLGIISNARCLTEGVDVPSVDMVAFMSPRKSRVDIVQAVGRAMRKAGPEKQFGYVFIPLFLNRRKGETLQQAFERSDFDEVASVVGAMQEQDEDLAEIIRELREERGATDSFDESRLGAMIEVLAPLLSLAKLRASVTAELIDRLGPEWDEMYGRLMAYKRTHGDCDVSRSYAPDPKLAMWVSTQRYLKRREELSPARIARLERLGLPWEPLEAQWEQMFARLLAYKDKHGDCNVPQQFRTDLQLSAWVAAQRQTQKNNKLSAVRAKRLVEAGFVWDPLAEYWRQMFERLEAYKRKHGHCDVSSVYKPDAQLAAWVVRQRRDKRRGRLRADFVRRLGELGFVWTPHATRWEDLYERLTVFQRRHGHSDVPRDYANDPQLAVWVRSQRRENDRGGLSRQRVELLEQLNFVWDPHEAQWRDMFQRLKAHKREHGHCNVVRGYASDPQLALWVKKQREAKKRGRLPVERVDMLEQLGLAWEPITSQWGEMFQRLVQYKRLHGDCNVPAKWERDPKLGAWVGTQRLARKRDKLEAERVKRLDRLGFVWARHKSHRTRR